MRRDAGRPFWQARQPWLRQFNFFELASRERGDGSASHLMTFDIAITITFTYYINFTSSGCATLLQGFQAV